MTLKSSDGASRISQHQISQIPDRTNDGVIQVVGAQTRDDWELTLMGKKPVLERRFGLASMIGFSCSIMITWEGTLAFIGFGFENGGPAGLIWGFVVCWIGTTSVFLSMGELTSMLPTAGGQYYWASVLAPQKYSRFISYLTGWITIIAWVATLTLNTFTTGILLQYLVKLNYPNFAEYAWQPILIMYAALLFTLVLNVWLGKVLPLIEIFILIIHVLGFFAFLVPLAVLGSTKGSSDVFTTFYNGGGWPNQGLSVLIGLFGNAAAFLGTDGAIHMCEEIKDSSVNTPRSMIVSITINGILGFVLLVVFLAVGGDLQTVLQQDSQFPYILILKQVLGELGGTSALVAVLIAMQIFCGIAVASSASRMVWSFAREQAVPGWKWLRLVNRRTSIPTNSNYVVILCACLLALINLGSTATFNALLSLLLEAFYLSYLIPLALLLHRRLQGQIKDYSNGEEQLQVMPSGGRLSDVTPSDGRSSDITPSEGIPTEAIPSEVRQCEVRPCDSDASMNSSSSDSDGGEKEDLKRRRRLIWGPWRLPRTFGTLNNIFAIAYLVMTMFFSFWPSTPDPSAVNMNWSVVVLGGVIIFSILYYVLFARKRYRGPKIEVIVAKM